MASSRPHMATPTCQKKRSRGTPTGKTPLQRAKQPLLRARESQLTASRRLTYGDAEQSTSRYTVVDGWTVAEERALVQFVQLHGDGTWNSSKKVNYWESAAEFVFNMCGTKRRTSKSIQALNNGTHQHVLYMPAPCVSTPVCVGCIML